MSSTYRPVRDLETQVAKLLGATENISLDVLIRQGLPLCALDKLAPFGLSATDLGILSKNVLRRRLTHGKPLTPEESHRLYRTSMATLLATSVFRNQRKSNIWLQKPRKAFNGRTALEAIATTPGYKAVVTLLEQLRYGFAA